MDPITTNPDFKAALDEVHRWAVGYSRDESGALKRYDEARARVEAMYAEALAEVERLRARLEINPDFPAHDGIACRDATIRLQDDRLAALLAQASDRDGERVAQLIAHRACCDGEHDPANGKLHGYCVVCGVPWPCEYAGHPPEAREREGWVMVPREPTEEMWTAGRVPLRYRDCPYPEMMMKEPWWSVRVGKPRESDGFLAKGAWAELVWNAMLAAAPPPPDAKDYLCSPTDEQLLADSLRHILKENDR